MPTYATQPQPFPCSRGEAFVLDFEPDSTVEDTAITSWTFSFTVRSAAAATSDVVALTKTIANGGITVVSATLGTLTVTLTSANTQALPLGIYDWELWRTNSGNESRLAFGKIEVIRSLQYPA